MPVKLKTKQIAGQYSNKCLSVKIPSLIPFGDTVAKGIGWLSSQTANLVKKIPFIGKKAIPTDARVSKWAEKLGITEEEVIRREERAKSKILAKKGYLVEVPNWEDVIWLRSPPPMTKKEKAKYMMKLMEKLRRNPTPGGVQEMAQLLTNIDNFQDDFVTLSVVLRIAEKAIGRAIPGAGWVATAADVLNVLNALVAKGVPRLGPGGIPVSGVVGGKKVKRKYRDKTKVGAVSYRQRLAEFRRLGKLRIGGGEILQILQSTQQHFGVGLQLGSIFGFFTDALFGILRGAEFRFPGPAWDPFHLNSKRCRASAGLEDLHFQAAQWLSFISMDLWRRAAEIMPLIEYTDLDTYTDVIRGMWLSSHVLGEWFETVPYEDIIPNLRDLKIQMSQPISERDYEIYKMIGADPEKPAPLPIDGSPLQVPVPEWIPRSLPETLNSNFLMTARVEDPLLQSFLDSAQATIAWRITGSMDGEVDVVEHTGTEETQAGYTIAEYELYPPSSAPREKQLEYIKALKNMYHSPSSSIPSYKEVSDLYLAVFR